MRDSPRWLTLAEGGPWTRFRHQPVAYTWFQIYDKLIYPFYRKGLCVSCRTFFGADMMVRIPAGAAIFLTGGLTHESEKKLIRYLAHRLGPDDVFVDVGAHFGFYSLLACHCIDDHAGGLRVLAVEPAASSFRLLKQNLQAYPHARAVHLAAGSREGYTDFYEFDERYSEYNSAQIGRYQNDEWLKRARITRRSVPCLPLQTLCADYALRPTVIKIDAEGMEAEIIAGAVDLLNEARPEIIMEFHAAPQRRQPYLLAERQLAACGYLPMMLDVEGTPQPVSDALAAMSKTGLDSDNIIFRVV